MKLKQYLTEKKDMYVGAKVKILRGKYKGATGIVDDYSEEHDQIDVKVNNRINRYLGLDDVKIIK